MRSQFCRSQIAEALGKHFASDVFESYSAGSEIKNQINPDAVRLMKKCIHFGSFHKLQRVKMAVSIN